MGTEMIHADIIATHKAWIAYAYDLLAVETYVIGLSFDRSTITEEEVLEKVKEVTQYHPVPAQLAAWRHEVCDHLTNDRPPLDREREHWSFEEWQYSILTVQREKHGQEKIGPRQIVGRSVPSLSDAFPTGRAQCGSGWLVCCDGECPYSWSVN